MEEVILRFPHLSEDIFNALDNKTFATCKEVSEIWYNYLDEEKFVQERRVGIIKKMIKKFQPDFQQNLEVVQANVSLAHFPDDSIRESDWCISQLTKQVYTHNSPLSLIQQKCKQFCMSQGMVILMWQIK